jgi:UDP-N-acetylmuramoyl-tripeptide--D-alanyl-D-alanine ligase
VTGSYGKTTTRELLHSVLSAKHPVIQNQYNHNNEIGVPLTLLQLKPEHRFLIVEMGAANPGDIQPLADFAMPNIGIFSGIGPAHLSGFGTIEQIVKTKGDLIASLPKEGLALIPGDSKWITELNCWAQCRVLTYGLDSSNSYHATRTEVENTNLVLEVRSHEYKLPLCGRHHLTTGLSVIAAATELGYSPIEIQQGFDAFRIVPGRGDVKLTTPITIIDDTYNANPVSCQAACETLANWKTTGKRVLILGDMLELGPLAAEYHEALGRFAGTQQLNVILAVGEHAGQVITGIRKSAKPNTIVLSFAEHDELIRELQPILTPGDVVLVKGSRGMRMETVVEAILKSINIRFAASAA